VEMVRLFFLYLALYRETLAYPNSGMACFIGLISRRTCISRILTCSDRLNPASALDRQIPLLSVARRYHAWRSEPSNDRFSMVLTYSYASRAGLKQGFLLTQHLRKEIRRLTIP